jgi:hemerythrin superfamily protein
VFDPLDHPGIPVDRHGRHWHEHDLEPIDARSADSYTQCRISTMQALEAAASAFDRGFAQRSSDADARRSVAAMGEAAARRLDHITALQPGGRSPLENAARRERAALDLVTWVARNEPEPQRSAAYRGQARRHLERLRSYAELGEQAGYDWADRIGGQVATLWPPSGRAAPRQPVGAPSAAPPAAQPMSRLHDWTVRAVHQQVARRSGGIVSSPRRRGAQPRSGADYWEQLFLHESAGCYLYYSFLADETDHRLKPLWELHLQMELAHLRAAGDLLRRYAGRDPQEVVGAPLAEPVTMVDTARYLWVETLDVPQEASAGGRSTSDVRSGRGRPDRGPDLVELVTDEHARTQQMFRRVMRARGDRRHTTFAALARMITAHEVVEEELVHPLSRALDPDDHPADRLLEEESLVSEALADAIRAERSGRHGDVIGALREMVMAHDRHEERDEFPRLRAAVPASELRSMARMVREVEHAATSDAGDDDPARAVAETGERVRDGLRTVS